MTSSPQASSTPRSCTTRSWACRAAVVSEGIVRDIDATRSTAVDRAIIWQSFANPRARSDRSTSEAKSQPCDSHLTTAVARCARAS